jgi:hypothetical protein
MKKLLIGALLAVALGSVGTPASAVDQEDINRAVERGIEALRRSQIAPMDHWQHNTQVGATALMGLTLLECGISPDDKDVQRAVQAVRKEAPTMTYTYAISLSILFLDRLGDPDDVPLIESLTVRLMAGQDAMGGWDYDCPGVSETEKRRLQANVDQRKELIGRREQPKPSGRRTYKDLPEEIRQQVVEVERIAAVGEKPPVRADNSNTQFAGLALWVGRRQGLPVERTLDRLGRRFRQTQNEDGGWAYTVVARGPNMPPPGPNFFHSRSTASMTCAGLICLAVSDATLLEFRRERKPDAKLPDLSKDPVVTRALQALGAVVENPKNIRFQQHWMPPGAFNPQAPPPPERPGAGDLPPGGAKQPPIRKDRPPDPDGFMNAGRVAGRTFYFLWSLERVAVAYDLRTIGNKDWYGWGAEIILNNQLLDGSWSGDHTLFGSDTCFALLFLKRANLARDLTAELKGRIKDPGERVIRAGGIGGDSLRGSKGHVESGIESKNTKPLQDPKLASSDSGRLAKELLNRTGERQTALLEQMRTEKGVKYTEALAMAIPQMEGKARSQARNALADRLTRMKEETLATYLQDEDAEIRSAAALACAMRESKVLVPNLITLIRDPETRVVLAAHRALKELTGQDFGPSADASRQDRDQAALKWLRWWTKQNREK